MAACARWHEVASHQLAGRGARAADGGSRDLALRTQQVLPTRAASPRSDPFGGSYFVEALTREMEEGAQAYLNRIDRMGGMVAAIERGFPQREIAEASYQLQQAIERKEQVIVGVNDFVQDGESPIPTLYVDEQAASEQLARLTALKASRDHARVRAALEAIEGRRGRHCEHDAADHRGGSCLCHPRRDVRRAARRLGRIRGNGDYLNCQLLIANC
ncbi:MAG: methylmalonyl-CoA mutase family protein [Vicinamibacterales bacterium]